MLLWETSRVRRWTSWPAKKLTMIRLISLPVFSFITTNLDLSDFPKKLWIEMYAFWTVQFIIHQTQLTFRLVRQSVASLTYHLKLPMTAGNSLILFSLRLNLSRSCLWQKRDSERHLELHITHKFKWDIFIAHKFHHIDH